MTALTEKTCTPCQGGIPPLTREEAEGFLEDARDWDLLDEARRIERTYSFGNFKQAWDFVNSVAELCEAEGHHADITFGWGYATVSLMTMKIRGLHENDFIMAAKINQLAGEPL
ncbi:MAG: pterin-4-alpha-carbinolamine dehydratase [Alphaproteobacteria bacterium]|nr:pterin-4-alpha-carbinolamine dehydratase [Alphaproteobacteria bacterium]